MKTEENDILTDFLKRWQRIQEPEGGKVTPPNEKGLNSMQTGK